MAMRTITTNRLATLAGAFLAGALAYHLSLTQPWNRGAGRPR